MTSADRRILFVHAHPDDESINNGLAMAKYAAEGAHVALVTCTLGEQGEILVDELAHLAADKEDGLGEHRLTELADAMKILGVNDHRRLGHDGKYRDSGMAWGEDGLAIPADVVHSNAFWRADLLEAADDLVSVLRELRPQVVVTYDTIGNYGHPDHIQAHRVTQYAVALAAADSHRRDLGPAWDVPKVYWITMSARRLREGLENSQDSGEFFASFDPDNLPPMFSEDEDIAAVIQGSDELVAAKLEAMKAHASQIRPDGAFFAMGMDVAATAWGTEEYRLVKGVAAPTTPGGFEDDLFAGL